MARKRVVAPGLVLPARRRGGLTVMRVQETRVTVEHVTAEGAEGHLRMMQDLTARVRQGWAVERINVTYRKEEPDA